MCEPPSCIRVCYSNSKCRLNATLTPRHDYPAPGLFTGLVATHRLVAATNAHGLARPSARVMYARPHFSGCLLSEPHHLGGESARRSVLPASSAGSTGAAGATPRVVFARAPPRRRRGPRRAGRGGQRRRRRRAGLLRSLLPHHLAALARRARPRARLRQQLRHRRGEPRRRRPGARRFRGALASHRLQPRPAGRRLAPAVVVARVELEILERPAKLERKQLAGHVADRAQDERRHRPIRHRTLPAPPGSTDANGRASVAAPPSPRRRAPSAAAAARSKRPAPTKRAARSTRGRPTRPSGGPPRGGGGARRRRGHAHGTRARHKRGSRAPRSPQRAQPRGARAHRRATSHARPAALACALSRARPASSSAAAAPRPRPPSRRSAAPTRRRWPLGRRGGENC